MPPGSNPTIPGSPYCLLFWGHTGLLDYTPLSSHSGYCTWPPSTGNALLAHSLLPLHSSSLLQHPTAFLPFIVILSTPEMHARVQDAVCSASFPVAVGTPRGAGLCFVWCHIPSTKNHEYLAGRWNASKQFVLNNWRQHHHKLESSTCISVQCLWTPGSFFNFLLGRESVRLVL